MGNAEHFKTTNEQLAWALITAGCSFAPQVEGGPGHTTYTPALLRKKGVLPSKGVSLEEFAEAAEDAYERMIPGPVTYYIIRNDLFTACIKKWDEMVDEFEAADKEKRAPVVPKVNANSVIVSCYLRAINQRVFDKQGMAFVNKPILRVEEIKSETREAIPGKDGLPSPGDKCKTILGLKSWPLGSPIPYDP